MRVEEKMHRLLCQTGASSLVLGIVVLILGLVAGVIGIINGSRLLKHNGDMF